MMMTMKREMRMKKRTREEKQGCVSTLETKASQLAVRMTDVARYSFGGFGKALQKDPTKDKTNKQAAQRYFLASPLEKNTR